MRNAHPLFAQERPFVIYMTDFLNTSAHPGADMPRMYWDGIQAESEAQNCDLLAVVGGGGQKGAFTSIVNDLIGADSADGFVTWAPYGGGHLPEFMPRFAPSRMVCLSTAYGDHHPTISVSNTEGIRALMEHLYHVHGYRRIAFIKGLPDHYYSRVRYESYCDSLAALGLAYDPKLVTDFGPVDQQGVLGIACLLDARGLQVGRDIDAIMCSSDRIALAALKELKRRGITVPEDVAITGYDNVQEAQSHEPAITSVSAPLFSVAKYAQHYLLDWIRLDRRPDFPMTLKSTAVIAGSCGCQNHRLNDLDFFTPPAGVAKPDSQALQTAMAAVFQLFRFPPPHPEAIASDLFSAFQRARHHAQSTDFIDVLQRYIRNGYCEELDQSRWQDLLSLLRKYSASDANSPAELLAAERLLDRARVAVVDCFTQTHTLRALHHSRHFAALRALTAQLSFLGEIDMIMDLLAEKMATIGIPGCWLSVFDQESPVYEVFQAPEQACLLLAIEDGQRHPLPDAGIHFPARRLLPEGVLHAHPRRTYILHRLAYAEEEYGFILFEQGKDVEGRIYEELAAAIGTALKNAYMREQLEKRTLDLELSIYELGRTRNKLVESEKLAALGELVAGIAHEINTPIGIGVTAISTVAESVIRLQQGMEARSVRVVKEETATIAQGADIALRNLRRANELIESFKQIAVDQTYEECRTFNLAAYLGDIVRSLEPRLRSGKFDVNIDCEASIQLTSYPGIFAQIISNLILNSLIHGFEAIKHGKIDIVCRRHDNQVWIDYRDDGMGMEPTTLEKVFHPFFTTKRGRGGTGLGMHIVYNLVTQKLGGSIECESSPGKGVFFQIKMPV